MRTSTIRSKHSIRITSIFLVVLLISALLPNSIWGQPSDSFNIIFILVDDHRWDALSILEHPMVQTPNLDRLCQEGVRFENAFVTTSLCSPSRASFLTGQYARTHGVQNNLTPWNNNNRTFFEQLKAAGYDTAFIGKWHMPGKLPQLKGVDRFITFTVQGGQGRYFDCPLIIDGVETPSRKHYITEELTDFAIEFVEQKRNTPFCLYLSHKAVHHQFLPPPHIAGMYKKKAVPMPPEADNWISWNLDHLYCGLIGPLKRTYRNYMEALHATDLEIGRLLDRLDSLGMAGNTIIIYWGDNGFFFGEHRLMDKRWPYEESIRVPCIVRDPRHKETAGKTAHQMVLNIDVAPTILEMAGLVPPPGMTGKSMLPFLSNVSLPGRDAWLYEYFQDFPYRVPNTEAVRTSRYKYVEYQGRRPDEIFDLQQDPKEQNNLMGTAQGNQLLPELRARLEALRQEVDR